MTWQVLMDNAGRAESFLRAFLFSTRGNIVTTPSQADSRPLLLYGVGKPSRMQAFTERTEKGWPTAVADRGYWGHSRHNPASPYRIALNAPHPLASHVDFDPPYQRHRPNASESVHRKDGHILVIGMGEKALAMYGDAARTWERQAIGRAVRMAMGRRVVFRPKRRQDNFMRSSTVSIDKSPNIAAALKGASFVICRHSNVGVDAIVHGVPCDCESGIAAHFWHHHDGVPSVQQRQLFLDRVAHWQYSSSEASNGVVQRWLERWM